SIKAEERERRRFAQELHDGLGPLLSTAKLYIKSLETVEDIEKKNYATLKSVEIIDEAISTIREIANNISPHILKNFGLAVAVRSFIKQVNETNKIKIELQADFSDRLAENIEITLFRVLVELIHNTLKHADADYISIQMEVTKGVLAVDFKDNGRGFDYEKSMLELSGQGISNILNRIHSLNGRIKFNEQIEKGSRVQIEIKMIDN
ncbi:MAG: sensor histidine kinase, partial [Bacteroidales bacterium]|nr:sensor histidine kinase [Bacteroidales bacterium]